MKSKVVEKSDWQGAKLWKKGSDLTLKIAQIWLGAAKSSAADAKPEPLANSNKSFVEFCLQGYRELPKSQTWNCGGVDAIEDGDHVVLRLGEDRYDLIAWKSALIGVLPAPGDQKEKKLSFRVASPKQEWTGFFIDIVKKGYKEATNYAFKLLVEHLLEADQGKAPQLSAGLAAQAVDEVFAFVPKSKTASLLRPFPVELNKQQALEEGDLVLFPVDGKELYGVCCSAPAREVIVLTLKAGVPALASHKAPEETGPNEKGTKLAAKVAKKCLEDFLALQAVCAWTGNPDELIASLEFAQYCQFSAQPIQNRRRCQPNKKEKENEPGDALESQKQPDGKTYTGFFAGDAVIGVVPQGAKKGLCLTKLADPLWAGSKIAAKNRREVLQLAYDLYLQDTLGLNENLTAFLKQSDVSSKFANQVTALAGESLSGEQFAANPLFCNGNVLKSRNSQAEFQYGVYAFSSILTLAPVQGQPGKWEVFQDSPAGQQWADASLVYQGRLKTALKAQELFKDQKNPPIAPSKKMESSSKEFANKCLGRELIN